MIFKQKKKKIIFPHFFSCKWVLWPDRRVFDDFPYIRMGWFSSKMPKTPGNVCPYKKCEKNRKKFWPWKSLKNGLKMILKQKKNFFFLGKKFFFPIFVTHFFEKIDQFWVQFFAFLRAGYGWEILFLVSWLRIFFFFDFLKASKNFLKN